MRRSILASGSVAFMVLLSACDSTTANPTPIASSPTSAPIITVAPATQAAATAPAASTPQASGGAVARGVRSSTLGNPPSPFITNHTANTTSSLQSALGASLGETLTSGNGSATAEPESTYSRGSTGASTGVPNDWSVVVDNDFTTGDQGAWQVQEGANSSVAFTEDRLNLTAKNNGAAIALSTDIGVWTDGYISATVSITGQGGAGVISRAALTSDNKTNWVSCIIYNTGVGLCYKRYNSQDSLLFKGNTSAIKRNGVNTVALLARGQNYTFFVNGKPIKSFTESDVTNGEWLLYTDSGAASTTGAYSRATFTGPTGDATPAVDTPAEDTPVAEDTPTTVPTAVPTVGRRPSPTPAPQQTPQGDAGNVIVSNDFSQGADNWPTASSEGTTIDVSNGEMLITEDAKRWMEMAPKEAQDIGDARIVADVRLEDVASKASPGLAGVTARFQSGDDFSQIVCGITAANSYVCFSFSADGKTQTVLSKGQSSAIKPNKKNTLSLLGIGSRWTFQVNGQKMGSFTYNAVKSGAWGILVWGGDKPLKAHYSQVTIATP